MVRRRCKNVWIFAICAGFLILSIINFNILSNSNPITHNRNIIEENTNDRVATGRGQRKNFGSNMDVYIVEEHHAVLKYWFDAAAKGMIPKKGNTLVHIDGHADLAMPLFVRGFPPFRPPRNLEEIDSMMQTNDAFILGAAITGLFSKIVWIWPRWDMPSHADDVEGEHAYRVGVTKQKVQDSDEYTEVFCTCMENLTSSKEECSYTPFGDERDKIIQIPKKSCKIRLIIEIYLIKETVAVEFLKSYIDDDNIVLDIDEDYYGCTLPAQVLVDKGISMPNINKLNTLLGEIVCAKDPEEENEGDNILFKVLEMLKSKEDCERIVKGTSCEGKYRRQTALNYFDREIGSSDFKCHGNQKLKERKLVAKLASLKIPQIEALQKVGFCLTTMPTNISFMESKFQICHGGNVPGETAVLDHPTNSEEIMERTGILQKILKFLKPFQIPLVTVCRSVRDGYTPREFFHHIEKDVISSLDVLGNKKLLHYDSWLLGGKRGWYNRRDTSGQ